MRKIVLAATLVVPMFASAAGPNLIVNGAFETFSGAYDFANNYSVVNAGSAALSGWTVSGTSIDLIYGGDYGAVFGNSIDVLGSPGPGSLSQTFSTVSGQAYRLSFDLSANMNTDNYAGAKALNVSLSGGGATPFTGSSTVTPYSLSFIANSAATTLTFTSASSGRSGAVLDNVAVVAVPEPQTYAMLIAGLGLMGGIVRRRKTKQV